MPVCKPFGDGIYEVRTSFAWNRIARVLFYIDKKGRWSCCMDNAEDTGRGFGPGPPQQE
jgi:hypothetical protein